MRLHPDILSFFKKEIFEMAPEANLYLFGSRTDDNARGGDIDLLVISSKKLPREKLAQLKAKFYQQFGEQRIDIINYTKEEENTFKNLIMDETIRL